MILWFILRKIYLVLVPISGTELLKLLEFPKWWVIKVSFVIYNKLVSTTPSLLMRWFLEALKDGGWLPGEPTMGLEGWNFQSHPPDLWGGERGWRLSSITNGQWFNQSWLCNETCIKTQKDGFGELLGWWTPGNDKSERMDTPHPSTCLVLGVSSIWLFLTYILW